MRPPNKDSTSASSTTDNSTGHAPKPMARSVAISIPRAATAENMLLSAPNIAPIAMMTATVLPTMLMTLVNCLDWAA